MNRRARWLLGGSLALNLFLAGLILGVVLMNARGRVEKDARPPRSLMAVAEQFDPEERDAFRELLRTKGREVRPRVRELRRARLEASEAMAAEPYEPTRAAAALDRARSAELALRRDLDGAVLQFATRLDAQERRLLGETMRRRGGGWKGDRRERTPQRLAEPRSS